MIKAVLTQIKLNLFWIRFKLDRPQYFFWKNGDKEIYFPKMSTLSWFLFKNIWALKERLSILNEITWFSFKPKTSRFLKSEGDVGSP